MFKHMDEHDKVLMNIIEKNQSKIQLKRIKRLQKKLYESKIKGL